MGNIYNSHVLLDDSAAGAGSWYKLNRHAQNPERGMSISLGDAGDSIAIEVTTVKPGPFEDPDTAILAADVVVADTFTGSATFTEVLQGSWTFVRAVKTGTAGTAKVQMNG